MARRDELVVFEGKPNRKTGARRFYWKLIAGNGEESGRSAGSYTRRYDAKRIGSKRHPKAKVVHEYPTGARVKGQ